MHRGDLTEPTARCFYLCCEQIIFGYESELLTCYKLEYTQG